MNYRKVLACLVCLLLAVLLGCSGAARNKFLRIFFDGVPDPDKKTQAPQNPEKTLSSDAARVSFRQHGPYAARMCNSCHTSSATNTLVAPVEELCFRCHEFPQKKKYVHGPLESGGCTVCHDPHSSQFAFLLVSDSDKFCFDCHDRDELTKSPAHQDLGMKCTSCHDAHMSDNPFLLK